MKRLVLALALLAGIATPVAMAQSPPVPPANQAKGDDFAELLTDLSAIQALGKSGKLEDAYTRLSALGAEDRFKPFLQDHRSLAGSSYWSYMAAAAFETQHWDDAAKASRVLTEPADARLDAWVFRLRVSLARHDQPDARLAFTRVTFGFPDDLKRLPDEKMSDLLGWSRQVEPSYAWTGAILGAVLLADWRPKDPVYEPTAAWVVFASRFIDGAQKDLAEKALARANGPEAFIMIRSDKRFDSYVAAHPGGFDVAAENEREAQRLRLAMEQKTDSLSPLLAWAGFLIDRDRAAEAMPLIDRAIAAVERKPSAFADTGVQLPWLYNQKSRALIRLARYPEAIEAMRRGAQHPEAGIKSNVSQNLNLSGLYLELGRPKEAVDLALGMSRNDANIYGYLVSQELLACAYNELGDSQKANGALANLGFSAALYPSLLQDTHECVGNLDAAADVLISRLRDPNQRSEALLNVQDIPRAKYPRTAFSQAIDERHKAIIARPDVQAAINAVGRIERQPIIIRQ